MPVLPLLVVCLDGFDLGRATPLLEAGRLPALARLLGEGGSASARVGGRGPVDPWLTWACALSGFGAADLGVCGRDELDGDGRVRRAPAGRRRAATACESASLDGRPTASVNLPFRPDLAGDLALAVTEEFFDEAAAGGARGVVGLEPGDLDALRVPAAAIGEEHLRRLAPGLTELGEGDPRRLALRHLLGRALSVHNVATAVLAAVVDEPSDAPLLACVRYDAVGRFHDAFADYGPPAAPYLTAADGARFAPLLPSVLELHDRFVARLIELMPAGAAVVVASDHGYAAASRRLVAVGAPLRRPTLPAGVIDWPAEEDTAGIEGVLYDLDLHRPANVGDYHTVDAWVVTDVPGWNAARVAAAAAAGPCPGLPMTGLCDLIAEATGIDAPRRRFDSDDDDDAAARERALDDRLELGLARLDVAADEARERHLVAGLDALASHAEAAGDLPTSIDFCRGRLARSFDPATALALGELLIRTGRPAEALALATTVSSRMPHHATAQLLRAAAHAALGDRRAAGLALAVAQRHAAAEDPRPAALAASWGVALVEPDGVDDADPRIATWLDGPASWQADWAARFAGEVASIDADDARLAALAPALEAIRAATAETGPPRAARPAPDVGRARLASSLHGDGPERRRRDEAEQWVRDGGGASLEWPELLAELHRRLAPADAPRVGRWRDMDVGCVGHWLDSTPAADAAHPSPDELATRIARLGDGAASAARAGFHPALLAAALAADVLAVHPFEDGNGRVARLAALEALRRGGLRGAAYLNLDRRYDRCRRLADSTYTLANRGQAIEAPTFWVRFLADAFADAAARAERFNADA